MFGAVALMLYSGVLTHFAGGLIGMHFHVFVSLPFLILYFDWLPIAVATVVIAVHHLILNELLPAAVFKDGPSRWIVALHAAFVVLEAAATIFLAERLEALVTRFKLDRGAGPRSAGEVGLLHKIA